MKVPVKIQAELTIAKKPANMYVVAQTITGDNVLHTIINLLELYFMHQNHPLNTTVATIPS